ncbi:MAG: carbon-nitrogen hydrolase family protein [Kangiellaceae bacterium]|nr:carbon-nitrogen hydrolase family protein [Kangiellaceae bacterium]
MSRALTVGLIQMCSTSNVQDNLRLAEQFIEQAVTHGAQMVILPESFALMEKYQGQKLEYTEAHGEGNIQRWMQDIAKKFSVCIVGGTIAINSNHSKRPYARCYVYAPNGTLITYYDKIHLFDVAINDAEAYSESSNTYPGRRDSVFEFNGVKFGLSVCYDLRFPELYRRYQQQNVEVILVPSAFTLNTGKVHWQLLLQARAVENLAFTLGANQTGTHDNQRKTFGHSMIVSPWGKVIAQSEFQQGALVATIRLDEIDAIKAKFPAHKHRRLIP